MSEELNYRIPPDILHYETKYLFGLSMNELVIGGFAGLISMTLLGPFGLAFGGIILLGMKRFDSLGNRSAILYLIAMAWHKIRPSEVNVPRTLPPGSSRIEVASWEGESLYTVEET